jgi:predicted nucleotidyltransferase
MGSLGTSIRKLRSELKMPLRTVAAFLQIDQALLSRIERGQRKATRQQVQKLSEFFRLPEHELMVLWLSDKLIHEIGNEEVALEALHVAEDMVEYKTLLKTNRAELKRDIAALLEQDGRVRQAWLYGSMVISEDHLTSDVNVIIEFKTDKNYSLFDLLDIAHKIESKIDRKVDLVEKGQLKNFAWETASQNLVQIYG